LLAMSNLFLRTLRQDPADAEVPSHRLLVRAGYIRRVAAGIYSWLPLGKIVLENIARVVREEMDAVGGQEVLLPALLPSQLYDASGRLDEYGDLLFRLADRRNGDYLLGPTHEELFTQLVKGEYSSYRDLPLILYQIQTKYRDEPRPRSGILRGREFLMKDSYSFDIDDAGLAKSYQLHREVYVKIFDRLGMRYRIATAVSGAMGGSLSEEFLAPAPIGEDTIAACTRCDYAANAEAVELLPPDVDATVEHPPAERLDTPDTPTIESLAALLGVPASATLKNILVTVTPAGGGSGAGQPEIVAVGVPGDREVDFDKLEAALAPAKVEIFTERDFAARPDLVRGYVGPQGRPADVRFYADPRIAPGTAWVTGANAADRHARNVVCGRDFTVDCYVDVATLLPGDPCPHCAAPLALERAIEIGHIFQLGRKYCDAFDLDVLGPDGRPTRVTMGSYGIGVSRAVAVLAEQTHDSKGLCWPREVAPADVHIVGTGKEDQVEAALGLAARLEERGLRVLVDDRTGVSPGVKFTDAELLGVPTIVVVGPGLADGRIELRDRRTDERRDIPLAEAVDRVTGAVRGA
jgi:prolyl-tRNA synthetase